ncbi:phospholipase DDHD1-like [Myzus persicae]|uniref:phospholipase DDHD1-like n=1 Tax=Myzus persicae TaxID=13164 RepID=UPI000B9372F4|nr:phospholipase DDHD1-like [Myzus persicae]XP_022176267.1 phospholipase DDHD1-like [Myzus persicae]XP_022176343.1 phospholipase DDHD1-like [Myzus persicae]
MNNMDTNFLQTEEPVLISEDTQDENNVSNTQTNGTAITFEPLGPEKVRWFYKSDLKRWTKFDGFDSLNIEYRYRANFGNEEDVSSLNGSFNYFLGLNTVVVRGGLYEVDLSKKKCTSIFWPGEESEIFRGVWFYDGYEPYEYGEEVEREHLNLFRDDTRKIENTEDNGKTVLRDVTIGDMHVVWYSSAEVYSFKQKTFINTKIMRSVTKKLGTYFQKSAGYKLIRSYKTDANEKDKLNDITHLVFLVHGIGHKIDNKKIIKNTSQFRDCVKWIKHKYFQGTEQRAEFFPVDWRSQCSFDGGLVEQITPLNLKNIRQILNSSAMDIMYYTSPIYGREIQNSLANELNRLHSEFVERHPHHDFKVSIMAHSLGSVISYDIITGWEPFIKRSDSSPRIHLNFELENFFCLGSPLSVFLALRQNEIFKENLNLFPMWLAKKVYNIYHPTDPVAYRFEPLVARDYCRYKPVGIQAYGIKCDYSEVPLELIGNIDSSFEETNGTEAKAPDVKKENETFSRRISTWLNMSSSNDSKANSSNQFEVNTYPLSRNSTPVENLNHRLDYILRDSIGGSASNYLSMLYTHTSYWSNYDVAYFIYTRLFPELDKTMEDFLRPDEKIPNFDLQFEQGIEVTEDLKHST